MEEFSQRTKLTPTGRGVGEVSTRTLGPDRCVSEVLTRSLPVYWSPGFCQVPGGFSDRFSERGRKVVLPRRVPDLEGGGAFLPPLPTSVSILLLLSDKPQARQKRRRS